MIRDSTEGWKNISDAVLQVSSCSWAERLHENPVSFFRFPLQVIE